MQSDMAWNSPFLNPGVIWCLRRCQVHAVWNDLNHALRALLKSPHFTLAVILTLAVGIASNTIIFSVTSAVFIHPLRYPDSSRLVYVSQSYPGYPQGGGQFSYPTYKDMLEGT